MNNAVGSLTQLQKSLIIGSILGDGYLRIVPGRKNAFLEINHALAAKEYVDWKYEVLKSISGSQPKMRKGNGNRLAYRFYTRQHPEITELFRKFYQNGKKLIPDDLLLDTTILAVWFMDDGSRCNASNTYLNTQQFSLTDQKKLLEKLKTLGLDASLNRDKIYWRIRFLTSSLSKLHELIGEKVINSMKYKLGYNPVETSLIDNQRDSVELSRYNTLTPSPSFAVES